MDIQKIHDTNLSRCARWHQRGIQDWSALEWAGAMAGEAGKAVNAAKKLKHIETDMTSIKDRHYTSVEDARIEVAIQVADTILYGLSLMARVGVTTPEQVLRAVFNTKSEDYGFPERL